MKKLLLISVLAMTCTFTFAQEDEAKDSLDGWNNSGKITLLINQSAFSNWQSGGDNSFAGNLDVNYDFNYTKGEWNLINKLLANYGLSSNKDDGIRKTDDRLELNSILGRHVKKNWSASVFLNFKTQFTDGYDFEDDYVGPGDNRDYPTSGFFKPAYLSFGPGMLWKKTDNLYVNFAPVTAKFTFITDEIFSYNEDLNTYESSNDVEIYGVAPGNSMLFEFGMNIRGYYKFEIMENVTMENLISLYSNYLKDPQNIDLDYTMNFVFKVNNVLSANFTFQTIYDDNAYEGFQVREVFGLGVNLNF